MVVGRYITDEQIEENKGATKQQNDLDNFNEREKKLAKN